MAHTLEEIRAEYRRLDTLTGVDTSGIDIVLSPRLVNHYGLCRLSRTGRRCVPTQIVIARFLLDEEDAFWDTIRHEYAHAALCLRTGVRHGHDALWKALCITVGASPSSRADTCEGFERRRAAAIRYVVRCETCGATFERIRKTAFIRAAAEGKADAYRCRRCAGNRFTLLQAPPPAPTCSAGSAKPR